MKSTIKSISLSAFISTSLFIHTASAQGVEILSGNDTVTPLQETTNVSETEQSTPIINKNTQIQQQENIAVSDADRGLPADSADAETLKELKLDAEELVLEAQFALQKIARHPDYKDQFAENIQKAKAVIVFPQIIKGAFAVLGAEGGHGVLLAKAPNGQWSYPSFYTMLAGSAGLQIGAQRSEMVVLVMSDKALVATLQNRVHLGGELNVAAGTEGVGYEKGITTKTNFETPDLHTYTVNQGLFIGASLEGSYMIERDIMNQAFYNTLPDEANTKTIIIQGQLANKRADVLRETLFKMSTPTQ